MSGFAVSGHGTRQYRTDEALQIRLELAPIPGTRAGMVSALTRTLNGDARTQALAGMGPSGRRGEGSRHAQSRVGVAACPD